MADMYGRLTGRAGVCLGTLGPGRDEPRHRGRRRLPRPRPARRADRAGRPRADAQGVPPVHRPRRAHAADHEVERPRRASPEIIPEVVRKAFKVAESEKPGATHLELPEDVMAAEIDAAPLPAPAPVQPRARRARAAQGRRHDPQRDQPGRAGRQRRRARGRRRRAARVRPRDGIAVAETFMGKGLLDYEDPQRPGHRRPAVARLRDGRLRGRRRGDRDRLRPRRALARRTGTPSATRRSSSSTPCPRRSTSTSCPRSS